jgi:hypothetical protein
MSALSISVPYPVFSGKDGLPLDNGYVWIGTANLYPITNPIAVYFDEALTIQATQPLRTINGYISNAGTPAQVYVDAANFSILVQDSKGSMVYNFPDGTGISPNASGIEYDPPFTGGVPTTVQNKLAQVVNVKDFGATGNNSTDDRASIQAAFDYLVSVGGGTLYFPDGRYRISNELNFFRTSASGIDIDIKGAGVYSTFIRSNFFGAGKYSVKCIDPAGVSRAAPFNIFDLQFDSVTRTGGVNPIYLGIEGWGESIMQNVRFGASNNTTWRVGSPQGVKLKTVINYYGGKSYAYKNTDSITFNVTSGTITASAAIFDASDIGKFFSIIPTVGSDNTITYTIATFISSTQVTVSEATQNTTLADGQFETARCSMTAGSAVLTANSNCFVAADVGRVICVQQARSGVSASKAILRGRIITYNAPNQVTLDVAADFTVASVFFGTPCWDFGREENYAFPLNAASSDVKMDQMHLEHFDGIGWFIQECDGYVLNATKIHGETVPIFAGASTSALWLDRFGGYINVDFETSCSLISQICYVANQSRLMSFPNLTFRPYRNCKAIIAEEFLSDTGYVQTGATHFFAPLTEITDYFVDNNAPTSPRLYITNVMVMSDSVQTGKLFMTRYGYYTPQGTYVYGDAAVTSGFVASYLSTTGSRVRYQSGTSRAYSIGNTPGGGASFVIRDESASLDRLAIQSNGTIQPGADATQNLGSQTVRYSNTFSEIFRPGDGVALWTSAAGSPEGVVTAAIGSLYTNRTGGAGTTLYVKESGAGNTGWVAK